jgi:hypothetical protein
MHVVRTGFSGRTGVAHSRRDGRREHHCGTRQSRQQPLHPPRPQPRRLPQGRPLPGEDAGAAAQVREDHVGRTLHEPVCAAHSRAAAAGGGPRALPPLRQRHKVRRGGEEIQ